MATLYTVSFLHSDGREHVSRFFQTIKAARNWARWLKSQSYVVSVVIWNGEASGEMVA